MSTLTFPILTFDEAKLSPRLGYVFDPQWLDPFESVVSMLWKLTWMNRLAGHVVVGHIAKRPVDPYEGIAATPAELDVRYVARTLGVPLRTVRGAVPRAGSTRRWCPQLRFCPRCMSRGYHSVVHQFGYEPQCPVHGCGLDTACRGCGATSEYRIDARLLDAPFRCAQCQRSYAHSSTRFWHRRPLPKRASEAIRRMFHG